MFFKLIQLAAISGALGMLVILPTACAEGIRHNKDLPIDGEATSQAVTGGPLVFKQSKEEDGWKWEPEDKNSIARLLRPSPPSPSPASPSTAKSSKSSSSKCSKSGKSNKSSEPVPCPSPEPGPSSPYYPTDYYLTRLLEEKVLVETEATLSTPMKKDLSVAAFIRVPKTGSTTMFRFLQLAAPHMQPWPRHLSGYPKDENEKINPELLNATACVFGSIPTTAHLGTNYDPNRKDYWWRNCPHMPYPRLIKRWSESLYLWSPPNNAVYADGVEPHSDPFTFAFNSFSVVRDPFDRLISFFYFLNKMKDTQPKFVSLATTDAQYERVMALDLYGWMELLHTEGGGGGFELPYQYKYFHKDVDTAVSLIQDDGGKGGPKVFIMLTECYEASLRLLTENFSGFHPGAVETFLTSKDFHSRENKKAYENVSKESLATLRKKAEVWFADDYKFYDAAVDQFKRHLEASNMDQSHLENCVYWGW